MEPPGYLHPCGEQMSFSSLFPCTASGISPEGFFFFCFGFFFSAPHLDIKCPSFRASEHVFVDKVFHFTFKWGMLKLLEIM